MTLNEFERAIDEEWAEAQMATLSYHGSRWAIVASIFMLAKFMIRRFYPFRCGHNDVSLYNSIVQCKRCELILWEPD
jgi:hypothetical protein